MTGSSICAYDAVKFPITEMPGQRATAEQLSMFYTRYHFARSWCQGRGVLEIACGGCQGLRYLAEVCPRAVGLDIDREALVAARTLEPTRQLALSCGDGHALPFVSGSFEAVLLLDAIYWLREPVQFLAEVSRVLAPGGIVLITSVNPDWAEFNPSPYATHYFNAEALLEMLRGAGFATQLYGVYKAVPSTRAARLVARIRRAAVAARLIPTSIRGKEILKRLFYGQLTPLPTRVYDGMAPYEVPVPFTPGTRVCYKLLYAVGRRQSACGATVI
ncbi:MAG: class I SAM-dependent methyltransferase [Vicinamibacterales bacterium]